MTVDTTQPSAAQVSAARPSAARVSPAEPAPATQPVPITMAAALNRALADSLAADDRVVVFGEDVATLGGVFRVTDGLAARFGDHRVFDTPLAEAGIVGTAIGMAMNGLLPVVEMQFDAFAYPAFEQVTSHLAKMRNRTRGRVAMPVVIRVPYGGGIGGVEHHCDSSESYYVHTPGLRVVAPATPADAYSLLRQAIDCPDPVVFLEPKSRYWAKEAAILTPDGAGIDQAIVRRPGSDVTLIAYGAMMAVAMEAADAAVDEGWDVEVIDVRSLSPLDTETLAASVRRTGRAVVVHEAAGFGGYGGEVAARLTEQCFYYLEAPVARVTGLDVPYPPPHLEHLHLPSADRVLDAIAQLEWDSPR
jgi:2-oxoisovalerate dehydrogenase E1 component beta subunit